MLTPTWQVWRKIIYPPRRHALYRALNNYSEPLIQSGWRSGLKWLPMLGLIVLAAIAFALSPVVLAVILPIFVAIPALIILFNGTVLGAIWGSRIASTLARYNHLSHRELVTTTPLNHLGYAWLIATYHIHRADNFRSVHTVVRWVVRVILILAAVVLALAIINTLRGTGFQRPATRVLFWSMGVPLVLNTVILYFDHIQSIVIGLLVSLLAPTIAQDASQSRGLFWVVFTVIQVLCYAVALLLYLGLSTYIGQQPQLSLIDSAIVAASVLVVLYTLREIIISMLFKLILARYQMTSSDFQDLYDAKNL